MRESKLAKLETARSTIRSNRKSAGRGLLWLCVRSVCNHFEKYTGTVCVCPGYPRCLTGTVCPGSSRNLVFLN